MGEKTEQETLEKLAIERPKLEAAEAALERGIHELEKAQLVVDKQHAAMVASACKLHCLAQAAGCNARSGADLPTQNQQQQDPVVRFRILSHRSAAFYGLGRYEEALDDANRVLCAREGAARGPRAPSRLHDDRGVAYVGEAPPRRFRLRRHRVLRGVDVPLRVRDIQAQFF